MSKIVVREERVPGPDGTLSVRIYGDGVPVLALHGYSDSGFSFARLCEYMPGYCLIAPDFRGHGKSDNNYKAFSISSLTDDAEAVLEALDIKQPFLIGHSMGAMTAISLAARHRVRALVAIGGALSVPADTASILRKHVLELLEADRGAADAFSNWHHCEQPIPIEFSNQLALEAQCLTPKTWLDGLKAILSVDMTEHAKRVLDPTLIVHGSEDRFFYPLVQNVLAKALRAVRSIEVRGVGHNPHWEAPETVAGHLRSFFRNQ